MRSWENGNVGQKDRRGKKTTTEEREREKKIAFMSVRGDIFPSSRDVRGVKNGFSVSTALSPYVFPVVLHDAFCFGLKCFHFVCEKSKVFCSACSATKRISPLKCQNM